MGIWIRNQNILVNANRIEYSFWNGHHRIYADGDIIASYKTKERAFSVLAMIQDYIEKVDINGAPFYSNVFKIPKE